MKRDQSFKVSIIIPVFNGEKTIGKCIDSVLAQSMKQCEILCCDDGSTDGTINILDQYSKNHKNIVLLKQENRGAGLARNKCLEIARGEFICFLDADDFYYDNHALDNIYDGIKKHNLSVGCGLMLKNVEGKVIQAPFFRNYVKEGKEVIVNFKDYQYDGYFVCYMMSRKLIVENNIGFPDLRRFQDPPFLVQCLDIAQRFVIIPTEFYYCNINNKKRFTDPKVVNDMLKGLKWQLEFAINHSYQHLTEVVTNRLNDISYASHIINALSEDNFQALDLLMDINRLLSNEKIKLDILRFMISEIRNIDFNCKKVIYEFENEIPRNSRIILYGAGKKGMELFSAITEMKNFEVIGWVDKYKRGQYYFGRTVVGIDKITAFSFDYILIAIQSPSVAESVKNELRDIGRPSDKMILYHQVKG